MKKTMLLAALAVPVLAARAQGFVGLSVAAIKGKARPDSVALSEMGKYGVTYYVESPDDTHHLVYNVTSPAPTGVCTSFEYLAPQAEKAALLQWLDRFYLRKAKNVWRSHGNIVLELADEGEQVRLTERRETPKPTAPKK